MTNIVSIIIPFYNVAPYVERCLKSISHQTYRKLEVILVDDCGSDESAFIVDRFIKKDNSNIPFVIIKHEHNKGLSGARNTGLKAATGKYVYFLDSDDEISADCIELLVNRAEEYNCDFVIGNYSDTLNENASPLLLQETNVIGDEILHTYAEGKWYVMAWNKLCNRNFLIQNNLFFEEGLNHEDVIWTFKLACTAETMGVVHEQTYKYSIRAASIMTGMSIEKDVKTYLAAFGKIKDYIIQRNLIFGHDEYTIFEGKKNGIMYSLLQKGETALFTKYYSEFSRLCYLSPINAYKNRVISFSYLIRDLHYQLPSGVGRLYKQLFYLLFYKLRGKAIEGVIWK